MLIRNKPRRSNDVESGHEIGVCVYVGGEGEVDDCDDLIKNFKEWKILD